MRIEFVGGAKPLLEATGAAAFLLGEGDIHAALSARLDAGASEAIERAATAGGFTGAAGQSLELFAPPGLLANRLLLIGIGELAKVDERAVELAAARAFAQMKASGGETLLIDLGDLPSAHGAHAALGVRLAAYRFDRYRTTEAGRGKPVASATHIAVSRPATAAKAWKTLEALADGIIIARDLVSEPANILYPEEFARRVKELASLGLSVEVLGEKEMRKLGMGALLGVGQGSVRESQLVLIQWQGAADAKAAPVAFVGKGVCFDSGGISLKQADGMEEMITDMGGAAAVVGTMAALAGRKARVNAVGVLGLVENMPDGAAQRPGDVVRTMSGQTVEVINTDAEGRLVLSDALWYCQQRFKPRLIVDLATLTGAIIVALGKNLAGLFSNDDTLAANLLAASAASHDALWRMPLPSEYDKLLDSRVADMKNTGGRHGGSIIAALFLQRFIGQVPWAHLDIASTAWKPASTVPTIPDGASGFGVRLLDRLVADHCEGRRPAPASS